MRIYSGLPKFSQGVRKDILFLFPKIEVMNIHDKIYEIRGQKVMLDFDLGELYGVETRTLNQAVKRNSNRFPEDFMFRLTQEEWDRRSQNVTSSGDRRSQIVIALGEKEVVNPENIDNQPNENSSQIVMSSDRQSQIVTGSGETGSSRFRNKGVLPYAFTEHGVTMLASVLRSEKAVNMSIAVVRAFIALKEYAVRQPSLTDQLQEIRDRLGEHDVQLNSIYTAIENLLDNRATRRLRTRRRVPERTRRVRPRRSKGRRFYEGLSSSDEVPGRAEELAEQREDRFQKVMGYRGPG